MEFVNACRNGDIESAKLLCSTRVSHVVAFNEACKNHQIDTMWWLIRTYPYDVCGPHTNTLVTVCEAGYLDFAEYIQATFPEYIERNQKYAALSIACKLGHADIARWLIQTYNAINLDEAFHEALCNDHLDIAKWLYTIKEIVYDGIFSSVCYRSNLGTIKWLYSIFKDTPTNIQLNNAYINACSRGKLDIVKWLLRTFTYIDVHHCDNHALLCSLNMKCNIVCKWLLENVYTFEDDYDTINEIMWNSCSMDNMDTIKWLLQRYPELDIHAKNDEAFVRACESGQIDTMNWLQTTYPDIDVRKSDRVCECICADLRTIQWFYDTYPDIQFDVNVVIEMALREYDAFHVVIYFIEAFPDTVIDAASIFEHALICGDLKMMDFLTAKYHDIDVHSALKAVYMDMNDVDFETISWLVAQYPDIDVVYDQMFNKTYNDMMQMMLLVEMTKNMESFYYMDGLVFCAITKKALDDIEYHATFNDYNIYSAYECNYHQVIEYLKKNDV